MGLDEKLAREPSFDLAPGFCFPDFVMPPSSAALTMQYFQMKLSTEIV
jgi:hypothetical protein